MAFNKSIPCRFFAQGTCKNGFSCPFIHGEASSTQSSLETRGTASPDAHVPIIDSTTAAYNDDRVERSQACRFFSRGSCYNGDTCMYQHAPAELPSQVQRSTPGKEIKLGRQNTSSSGVSFDSRSTVPCKFFSRPGGCQNNQCPFLHVKSVEDQHRSQEVEPEEDEDEDSEIILTRDISGASVRFNEFGHVIDVVFPTDYSSACITGFAPGVTPNAVVDMLCDIGFDISADCVRVLGYPVATATKVTLKVKDPLFARNLCDKLNTRTSTLHASIMPLDARQTNWRKLLISWHKATRSVWLNFGNGDIAGKVAKKFNNSTYKCLGHVVQCSLPTCSKTQGRSYRNSVPWTIMLSSVPGKATSTDVEKSIFFVHDRPRHVEMGRVSYHASEPDVSVAVRSCLEKYGLLESFSLIPTPNGKRAKAVAMFQDEADAREASALNNTSLAVLGKGKLTVTLVQSIKIKVATVVYSVSKSMVEEKVNIWKRQHLTFRDYTDSTRPLTTLKIEGSNAKDVATASRELNEVISGTVLVDGDRVLWGPTLGSNGIAYQKLQSIAKDLGIVIIREKLKQQLRFHGPVAQIQQAVSRVGDMLNEESSSSYEIDLDSDQFSWAIQGGFKSIQQALNENVAVFNVVSRKIVIHGTTKQYDIALAAVDSRLSAQDHSDLGAQLESKGDCPICFCEAENPIQCSCKHTYCLECFEGFCESAASTSQREFQIKCCGSEGTCSTIFALKELKKHLPSSGFEKILQDSFKEYIQRRPNDYHSCPTPDCNHIYRCFPANQNLQSKTYTCPSCFEQLCPSCHAQHGTYTCAEYKDIASGGIQALEKLKKELNIKDCPRCKTPMEKTMGCNHMTCGGCKAHICWVCMSVFDTSTLCYEHMTKVHGGIGLELERFMD